MKNKKIYPDVARDYYLFRAAIKTYLGVDNRAFAKVRECFRNPDNYMNVLSIIFKKDPDDIILDLTKEEQEVIINDIINDPAFN